MSGKILFLSVSLVVLVFSGGFALASCPSADLTGDCFVDFEDFAIISNQWINPYDWESLGLMANQWLTSDPCVPDDMVYIPDGEFLMGDSFNETKFGERPVHAVYVDSFYMSSCEITNRQYCQFLNSALGRSIYVSSGVVYGSANHVSYCYTHSYDAVSQIDYSGGIFSVRIKGDRDDMSNDPVGEVSWYGAVAYCNWRSQQEGKEQCYNLSTWESAIEGKCDFSRKGYRLPTEAEWEYAARGGLSGKRFPWGDTISHSQANYYSDWKGGAPFYPYDVNPTEGYHRSWNDEVWPYTSPVGSFQANGYGLYDMAGNVWEWCNDWYSSTYYRSSPSHDPTGPTSGTDRVLRSGCWANSPFICRVAGRGCNDPGFHGHGNGFRISLDLN